MCAFVRQIIEHVLLIHVMSDCVHVIVASAVSPCLHSTQRFMMRKSTRKTILRQQRITDSCFSPFRDDSILCQPPVSFCI